MMMRGASFLGSTSKWTALRGTLAKAIWPDGIPTTFPTVTIGYSGSSYASSIPADVSRVDRLMATLPRGGTAEVHLIHPSAPAINRLAIVHGGHAIHYFDESTNMLEMTRALLLAGFHVLGCCMPVDGYNAVQSYQLADGTPVTITAHNFSALEADGVHPLRFFLDGTVQALNYAIPTLQPRSVDMTGISGGGWTTDFLAAVDRRIEFSAPVFGSLPFTLRPPGDLGDWEQFEARSWWTLLEDAPTLYTLGCFEFGRQRLQILGEDDPVFPVATVLAEVAEYGATIDAVAPGQHEILIDSTTSLHEYSPLAVEAVRDLFLRAA